MTTSVLLEFPGGRFGHCDASFESHFQSRLLVAGTEGTLHLDRAFSAKDFDVAIDVVRGGARETVPIAKADMFLLMVDDFDEAVLGRAPLRFPASDAWHNMRAIDACFESIRTGERVAIAGSGDSEGRSS
jgi:predicted dehydrogenase